MGVSRLDLLLGLLQFSDHFWITVHEKLGLLKDKKLIIMSLVLVIPSLIGNRCAHYPHKQDFLTIKKEGIFILKKVVGLIWLILCFMLGKLININKTVQKTQ